MAPISGPTNDLRRQSSGRRCLMCSTRGTTKPGGGFLGTATLSGSGASGWVSNLIGSGGQEERFIEEAGGKACFVHAGCSEDSRRSPLHPDVCKGGRPLLVSNARRPRENAPAQTKCGQDDPRSQAPAKASHDGGIVSGERHAVAVPEPAMPFPAGRPGLVGPREHRAPLHSQSLGESAGGTLPGVRPAGV